MKSIYSILKNPKTYLYIFIFAIMFLLTNNMHFNADEYNYSNIPWTNTRVTSLNDILTSQKILYFNWTGRIIVHSLIQLFIFIGNTAFSIVNSLIFCAFIYLISGLINSKKTPYLLLLTFIVIWFFTPVFGETTIWLSGTINYLWPSTLLLLLLNLYSKNNLKTPWLMIIALITGASHEMILICGGAYFLLDICISKFNRKKLLVFLCFIIGGLFLVLAPGNFIRASQSLTIIRKFTIIKIALGLILFAATWFLNKNSKTTFIKYINTFKEEKINRILSALCILLFIPLLILNLSNYLPTKRILLEIHTFKFVLVLIPVFALGMLRCIKHNISAEKLLTNLNLFSVGIVSALAMSVMPECPSRSFFLSCTIINISIISLFNNIEFKKSYILSSAICILSLITLFLTVHYYIISLRSWKKDFNTQIIANKGNSQVVLPIQPKPSRIISNYYGAAPSALSNTPNSITNFYVAKYYNFEQIVGVEKNTTVMKIEKDNIDKTAIYFEYTNPDKTIKKSYPEEILIDPSKASLDEKQAFISIPSNATNVKFINNSNIEITDADITTYKLN